MIIKSIVVIDGKEVEVKELEDKEAFAESAAAPFILSAS